MKEQLKNRNLHKITSASIVIFSPMSLVNYSSSSEEVLSESENPVDGIEMPMIKNLLPKAIDKLGKNPKSDEDHPHDDCSKHEGRVRSFKHERGNWATHVYIPVNLETIEDIQEMCKNALKNVIHLHRSSDLHISLSKTVVLQYHFIESFCKSLELALDGFVRFTVCLRQLKCYTNEEATRTFIGFEVDELYYETLHKLMSAVDSVMQEHKLAKFYEDASFHISLFWCTGDHVQTLNTHLTELKAILQARQEQSGQNCCVDVSEIHCKTGNKRFIYNLK